MSHSQRLIFFNQRWHSQKSQMLSALCPFSVDGFNMFQSHHIPISFPIFHTTKISIFRRAQKPWFVANDQRPWDSRCWELRMWRRDFADDFHG
jgi:hypothetical protein